MKIKFLTTTVLLVYLWVMVILLGSIVLETFMIYPNIFHNPPESLAIGMQFMAVAAPSDFFPPLGFASWITGAASVILGWRVKAARYWIVGSVLMIMGEGVASMTLFWPRNAIMFVEGLAVHSPEFLIQTAREFERLHWLRVGFNVMGSALIFVGFLRYYRHLILSGLAREQDNDLGQDIKSNGLEGQVA